MSNRQVNVKANLVNLNFQIQVIDANVATAQDKAAVAANNVFESAKSQGISADDIVTTGFNIYPQYTYTGSTSVITGYSVQNEFSITVRFSNGVYDSVKVAQVLDSCVRAGGNSVRLQNLQYDATEDAKKEAALTARALALQGALDK